MRQKLKALLQLGRVSNLPTIWTNCIAAWVLVGADFSREYQMSLRDFEFILGKYARMLEFPLLVPLTIAASLLYMGGTALNDAFDIRFDRKYRPDRPIPAGVLSPYMVWVNGLASLAAGTVSLLSAPSRPQAPP